MKSNRTVLVICALGYATSTMIKKAISEFLEGKGITGWGVEAIGLTMSQDYVANADIIVSSLDLKQSDYKAPVLNGVPLISGIGKEAVLNQILEHVKAIENPS